MERGPNWWCVKDSAGKVLASGFRKKKEAKEKRDGIKDVHKDAVVSRGPDHPFGESFPDSSGQNFQTPKKNRSKKPMTVRHAA